MTMHSPLALWARDPALYSYVFGLFLIGLPFTLFGTYIPYQLQITAYTLGHSASLEPCTTSCLVPFGPRLIDLNAVLLYLNALGFGLGGAAALLLSAYADFWGRKNTLVALLTVCYGVVSVPVYWLRDQSWGCFRGLMALYVVYAVLTYVLTAAFSMYIPHLMRVAGEQACETDLSTHEEERKVDVEVGGEKKKVSPVVTSNVGPEAGTSEKSTRRKYGFNMSIWGAFSTAIGGILCLLLVIVLSRTTHSPSAGLLLTTATGFLTIFCSPILYFNLPAIPSKPAASWFAALLTPLRDIRRRKNMAMLLLSYTVYTDTVFALNSVTGQLFFAEVRPDTLEYSLYSLAFTVFTAGTTMAFWAWRPKRLERWLVVGYAIILVIPIWGIIGFANESSFGLKKRWEFYIQGLVFNISGSIVNSVFRVLFAELVPKGSEMEWFALQVVVSCATAWVSYVVNAPLQNATHELRFPLVLCAVILVVPVVLEVVRGTMGVFEKDRRKWEIFGEAESSL